MKVTVTAFFITDNGEVRTVFSRTFTNSIDAREEMKLLDSCNIEYSVAYDCK